MGPIIGHLLFSLQVFQREEEDRISKLRDILWRCTNIDSQLCVEWDEVHTPV